MVTPYKLARWQWEMAPRITDTCSCTTRSEARDMAAMLQGGPPLSAGDGELPHTMSVGSEWSLRANAGLPRIHSISKLLILLLDVARSLHDTRLLMRVVTS